MEQIISDSYYIIGLHQDRLKNIDSIRLNNLLYLLDTYYNCINDCVLYPEGFQVDLLGPYNKTVKSFFRKRDWQHFDR